MKILIVEDNMILKVMIEKWLQKAGYEVLTAIDEPGVLKTVDIRSPKTVISVHFSYSLPMAIQIY